MAISCEGQPSPRTTVSGPGVRQVMYVEEMIVSSHNNIYLLEGYFERSTADSLDSHHTQPTTADQKYVYVRRARVIVLYKGLSLLVRVIHVYVRT